MNARLTPQRLPRAFKEWTRCSIQIIGGNPIQIGHEQGEAQDPNDGLQLTQANTSPPYDFWWLGELWYSSPNDNTAWRLIIIGPAGPNYHP